MVTEKYTVTLEKEIVERAKEMYKDYGGKLSPLLNQLLDGWNKQEELKLKQLKKEGGKTLKK